MEHTIILIHKMFSSPSLNKESGKMHLLSAQCINIVSKHGKCGIFIHQCNLRGDSVPFQTDVQVTSFVPVILYQS